MVLIENNHALITKKITREHTQIALSKKYLGQTLNKMNLRVDHKY